MKRPRIPAKLRQEKMQRYQKVRYLTRTTTTIDFGLTRYLAMDVDTSSAKLKSGKGRIEKRKASSRKASIVFPKYKNGKKVSRAGKK